MQEAGGRALPLVVDVADAQAVDEAADRVEQELGPVDVWVNAAFSTVFAPVPEIEPEELRRATEVTYFGFVYGTQAALRHMLPRDRGTIVQVGSALAYRSVPLQAAYCGAKHAIKGFTESLRCELLHDRSGCGSPWCSCRRSTPAVQLGAVAAVPASAARAADLPAGGRRAGILHAADHPERREHWVGGSTVATLLGQRLGPGCWTATSRAPATTRSRRRTRSTRPVR